MIYIRAIPARESVIRAIPLIAASDWPIRLKTARSRRSCAPSSPPFDPSSRQRPIPIGGRVTALARFLIFRSRQASQSDRVFPNLDQ